MNFKIILIVALYFSSPSLILCKPYLNTDSIQIENIHKLEEPDQLKELKKIAFEYFEKNQFEKSIKTQLKHLELAQTLNDSLSIAQSYHRIASSYCAWDKYKLGIQYYYKAYESYKNLKDTLWMAHEMNDIGFAYLYFEDYPKVIEFYQKSLKIYKHLNIPKEIALAEANIGFAYSFWGNQDEAIKYHTKALKIYKELNDSSNFAKMYHGLGDALRRKGNYAEALLLLKDALNYSRIYGNTFNQNEHLIRIAQVYTEMGNFKKAELTFNECIAGLKERNSGKWWKNYYEALYVLNQKRGNLPKALDAFKKFKIYEDSLFNEKLQSEIIEMQILNETKEKEQKIILLQTKNKLAQTEILFQKKILKISIGTLAIFAILLGFIYKQYLSRNKAFKKLFEKNKDLIDYEDKYKKALQQHPYNMAEPIASSYQIKDNERERIILKLEHLIEEKKLYTNCDLNLNQLCKKLQTNSAYLSHVINQQYGKNINTYLNEYRIKEVQRCLINGEHKALTIEAIASKSGFKTRATFNTAFKKITGITPSFYINSLKQEKSK